MLNKPWSHKQLAIYLLVVSLLILAAINFSIYKKQQILQHGVRVFLELRPVDPRSLLQGDYMRLAYSAEQNQVISLAKGAINNNELWVQIDSELIGTTSRAAVGALGDDEYVFKAHKGKIRPNSFMFQEDYADIYAKARYAVFVFAQDSRRDYVLSALADKDRRIIEVAPAQFGN